MLHRFKFSNFTLHFPVNLKIFQLNLNGYGIFNLRGVLKMVKNPNQQPLENFEKKLELCLPKLWLRFVGEKSASYTTVFCSFEFTPVQELASLQCFTYIWLFSFFHSLYLWALQMSVEILKAIWHDSMNLLDHQKIKRYGSPPVS